MPDDGGPGELDQVRDAAAFVDAAPVPEHPSVVPELVEPAEVAVDDPPLRFPGVAALGPPPGELPHVVVQLTEDLAGHHSPVVGSPPPDDRGERGDDRRRVRAAQGAHLVREPLPEPLDGRWARRDQQLAVSVTADIEPQEIEPLGQVHDLGLVLVEDKTPGCQPSGEPGLGLLGLFPGVSTDDQVIGVSDHDRGAGPSVPGMAAGGLVPDSRGLLQPMERHVHHQRTDHAALRSSLLGRGEAARPRSPRPSASPRSCPWPGTIRARRVAGCDRFCRTKPRLTTGLEDLPSAVRITRPRHPLQGRSLRVLGGMRRHGVVELLLVLPDGSKSLIPAAWTDAEPSGADGAGVVATLGSLSGPAARVRAGHRPVAARTARAGTGCRDVTVQGGLPCSLSSSV